MMTWMTRKSLFDSAADLELPQLALAQRESEALFNELLFANKDEELGSAPIPLVRMWSGYEVALAAYSSACAATLVGRGVSSTAGPLAMAQILLGLRRNGDPAPFVMPPWAEDTDVLLSHRSNLMRRWPEAYSFPNNPTDMPYIWPIVDDDGGYVLKLSKYDRGLISKGERRLSKTIMGRIAS